MPSRRCGTARLDFHLSREINFISVQHFTKDKSCVNNETVTVIMFAQLFLKIQKHTHVLLLLMIVMKRSVVIIMIQKQGYFGRTASSVIIGVNGAALV